MSPAQPRRVAWINEGAAHQDPWTAAHRRARATVDAELGERVGTTFVEGVELGEDAGSTIDRLVDDGHSMVVATSAALWDDVSAAAKRHPSVVFEQARGPLVTANVSTFSGAHEEAVFLTGIAGGSVTSTRRIGFVATVPEPETVRHVNAYALGARRVDPTIDVVVVWVGSWYDPDRERGLAARLVAEGADVLATGATSPAVADAAEAAGVPWSGHDWDASTRRPEQWLTASLADWRNHAVDRVRAHLDGRWTPIEHWGGLHDGFTRLAPLGRRVAPPARREIQALGDRFRRRELDVFAGPLVDADGRLRVEADEALTHSARMTMDWFVEGVVVDDTPPPSA